MTYLREEKEWRRESLQTNPMKKVGIHSTNTQVIMNLYFGGLLRSTYVRHNINMKLGAHYTSKKTS